MGRCCGGLARNAQTSENLSLGLGLGKVSPDPGQIRDTDLIIHKDPFASKSQVGFVQVELAVSGGWSWGQEEAER